MKKTLYKNPTFYYLLISYIILLLIWNSYALYTGQLYAVIPIVIQLVILYLVSDKNEYAKNTVKIWSIVLIVGPSLSILGKLIKAVAGVYNFDEIIQKIIFLSIGILIFHFNNTTVEVKNIQEDIVEN